MNLRKVLFIIIIFAFLISSLNGQTNTPVWSYDATIYEVNIRQYSEEGTFKEFEKDLPRLKELGVKILWLMPVHPIGELNRKGNLGSYYSVKDYFDVNPEFGTKQDFKELVEKIHSLGMYVIIDWVANHTSWDNNWVINNPEFYSTNENGEFIPPVDDWTDVIDLNYENKDLWRKMTEALKYWVEEFNIDGYRCDVAGMVPIEFWNQARIELEKIKPVFMLAEWNTPEMHDVAFDMTYDWDLHKIMNGIAKGEKNCSAIRKHLEEDNTKYPDYAFRMQFTDNHDENSWNGTVYERLGDASEIFAALTFVLPDMPLIYSGQEAGSDKRLKFFEKDPIEWKENEFENLYKDLTELKNEHKALHCGLEGGEIIWLKNDFEDSILSFAREKNGSTVVAVFNLSSDRMDVNIAIQNFTGEFLDFSTDERIKLSEILSLSLEKWEYKIFTK